MFNGFSDLARIWIYGFEAELSSEDIKVIENELNSFVADWKSHKDAVKGSYEILLNRFVILVAESSVSGCSIDSSVSVFKKLRDHYKLDALNQDLLFYRNDNVVSAITRDDFQKLVNEDKIDWNTLVYNMTPTMLGVFRAGQWELPFSKSWHGQVFKKSA